MMVIMTFKNLVMNFLLVDIQEMIIYMSSGDDILSYNLFYYRELHSDVQNLKAGKTNNDTPPYSEVLSAFKYI
jgi:hypothetical protein